MYKRQALPTLAQTYGTAPSDVHRNALAVRVATVGDRLRAPEPRVSASISQQGLAARLWSVALGCAAVYGRVPDLDPRLLRWDATATAPDDLWLIEVHPLAGDAGTLADTVLHGHLEPLGEALRARYGVAAGLLWGNAGSALLGAGRRGPRTGPLGTCDGPWRGGGPGPRPHGRTPRPSAPAHHRHPHRHGLPPPQLLPVLPRPRRRSLRRLLLHPSAALFPGRRIWVTMKGTCHRYKGVVGCEWDC